VSSSRTPSYVVHSGKQLQKHVKCLKVYLEMRFYHIRLSQNGLKYSYRDFETLKMTQGVGSLQLLDIQKHLQTFVNMWPDTVEWPKNWCRINSLLTGKWFMRFFMQIWERGSSVWNFFVVVIQFSKGSTESQHVKTSCRPVRQIHTFWAASLVEKGLV
jgi:hypothetical protein